MTVRTTSIASIALGSIILAAILQGFTEVRSEVLFSNREGGIAYTALISARPLTATGNASALSRFRKPSDTVSQLQVFSNRTLAAAILNGKGATDLDEQQWYSRYLEYAARHLTGDVAEVLRVGNDVAARFVVKGKSYKKILAGGDPYRCESMIPGCEIIWITVGRIPPGDEGPGVAPMIYLFVKTTSPVTATEAQLISRNLQARFITNFLVVAFRTDEWFVTDLAFPIMYPFRASQVVVDPQQIAIRDDHSCVVTYGEFGCH
jgi:hypothetical protein